MPLPPSSSFFLWFQFCFFLLSLNAGSSVLGGPRAVFLFLLLLLCFMLSFLWESLFFCPCTYKLTRSHTHSFAHSLSDRHIERHKHDATIRRGQEREISTHTNCSCSKYVFDRVGRNAEKRRARVFFCFTRRRSGGSRRPAPPSGK